MTVFWLAVGLKPVPETVGREQSHDEEALERVSPGGTSPPQRPKDYSRKQKERLRKKT